MKKIILCFTVLLLLAHCSPQKRLHRLITKHPELIQLDTIIVQDSVFVPGVKIDTVFHLLELKDTVFISKDNLQIQLVEINDTVYLDAEVKADTVVIIKEISVEKLAYVEPIEWYIKIWDNLSFWVIILFICVLIRKVTLFFSKER